jgi:glutaredoxin
MPTVTLYTKPDCHLCDVAHEVLEEVREEFPFDIDGVEHFEHRVDERELRSILTEGMNR